MKQTRNSETSWASQETIKTHLHNLFEKLGVSDRLMAVTRAIRLGLLSLD